MKKRLFSVLLIAFMLLGTIPSLALAIDEESEEIQASTAAVETVEENTAKPAEASNFMWEKEMYDLILEGLKKLPSAAGQKAVDWGKDKIYKDILGLDPRTDEQKILDALKEIQEAQLKEMMALNEIKAMLKDEQDQKLLDEVNKMYTESDSLASKTETYYDALDGAQKLATEDLIIADQKKTLIYSISGLEAGHEASLDNNTSAYDDMVYNLGKQILEHDLQTTYGNYNRLDLENVYCFRHYKWEHQGYEERERYWSYMVQLYVSSAGLDQASLRARIETYENTTGKTSTLLAGRLERLNKQIEEYKKVAEETAPKRAGDEYRVYQLNGTRYVFKAKAEMSIFPDTSTIKASDFDCPEEKRTSAFWESWYMKDKLMAAPAKVYTDIYNDFNYNKTKEDKTSLYDIFFGEIEDGCGGFIAPAGSTSKWYFATSDVVTISWDYWKELKRDRFKGVYAKILNASDASQSFYVNKQLKTVYENKDGKYGLLGNVDTLHAPSSYHWDYLPACTNGVKEYWQAKTMMLMYIGSSNEEYPYNGGLSVDEDDVYSIADENGTRYVKTEVDTSDHSNVILYTGLLIIALVGVFVVIKDPVLSLPK